MLGSGFVQCFDWLLKIGDHSYILRRRMRVEIDAFVSTDLKQRTKINYFDNVAFSLLSL